MKAAHANRFYCATEAGGCGGRLGVYAGAKQVPHFRHLSGPQDCVLAQDPARARNTYEHLWYQRAIQKWLNQQGIQATLEKRLTSGGRTDLHYKLQGHQHSIEIQLSPISLSEWQQRDERYRQDVQTVRWLFGPGADDLALGVLLQEMTVQHVRTGDADADTVEVGLSNGLGTHWAELARCSVWARGIECPATDLVETEVVASLTHQRAIARAREASRWPIHTPTREPSRSDDPDDTEPDQLEPPLKPLEKYQPDPLPVPRLPLAFGTAHMPRPLLAESWALLPGVERWAPTVDWAWLEELPEHLRPAAKMRAYLVTTIYLNGPLDQLTFADLQDHGQLAKALEKAGFIETFTVNNGYPRWRRSGS